jgi:arylformamidase
MRIGADIGGIAYAFELDAAVDCTRAVDPRAPTAGAFGLPPPTAAPLPIGGGRHLAVAEGASVDCFELRVHAHGAGTHVECVGHIVADDVTLLDVPRPALYAATLVHIAPTRLGDSGERYLGRCDDDDAVLTAADIAEALAAVAVRGFDEAIVLRTERGSGPPKAEFSGSNPPYPTDEAAALLASLDARLLVLDLPSLDREDDGGGTANHHRWWGLPMGARRAAEAGAGDRLVCELARIPAALAAGPYLLQLDVAPIAADAAPARVRLVAPLGRGADGLGEVAGGR